MKTVQLYSLFLILSFGFGSCRIFKESDLDPNGDFGSMAALYKLFQLTETLNTSFNASLRVNFAKTDGSTYAGYVIKYGYAPGSTRSERSVSEPKFVLGEGERQANIDASGDAFVLVQRLGILTINIYTSSSSNEPVASVSFRVYSTLSTSNFTIYSQTGDIRATLQDISVLTGFLSQIRQVNILGVANGRIYAALNVFETNVSGVSNIYLASSADGLTFDRITKITDLTDINSSSSNSEYWQHILSRPGFDGSNIVFFIRKEIYNTSYVLTSVENKYIQFEKDSQPSSLNSQTLQLSMSNNRILTTPSLYPLLYFSNRWVSFEQNAGEGYTTTPVLRDLALSSSVDLYGTVGCGTTGNAYYTFQVNSSNYLNCSLNSIGSGTGTYQVVTSNITSYSDGYSLSGNYTQSRIYPVNGKLFSLQYNYSVPTTKLGYLVTNTSAYGTAPISINTAISNFSVTFSSSATGSDTLDSVQSSDNRHFFIIQNNDNASQKIIFRSTDDSASVTQMQTLTSPYLMTGDSFIYHAVGGSLVAIGSDVASQTYLMYRLNDGGTWDAAKFLRFTVSR
ncbi:hypothetical protein [Leptospira idonii]|uniref:Uncharacterized protein n=1 Tax=Leptospira idonii TaxID=1193500 RepID=A0A4R9M2Y4_9LEPT|nr:hypothetical protein [Leptospira idonii]TGN21153.1 hypothetical protein EHS15_01145 [Leptospira idonii]